MFEKCTTLFELGAARTQEASKPTADIIAINNAYNEARARILSSKKTYMVLTQEKVSPRPVNFVVGIPIIGYSNEPGVISLTEKGFLF